MFKPIILPSHSGAYSIQLTSNGERFYLDMTEEGIRQLQQYIDKVHPAEKSDLTGEGDEGNHWV